MIKIKSTKQRVNDLEILNKIASKSKLSKKEAERLSKKIKISVSSKFN